MEVKKEYMMPVEKKSKILNVDERLRGLMVSLKMDYHYISNAIAQ